MSGRSRQDPSYVTGRSLGRAAGLKEKPEKNVRRLDPMVEDVALAPPPQPRQAEQNLRNFLSANLARSASLSPIRDGYLRPLQRKEPRSYSSDRARREGYVYNHVDRTWQRTSGLNRKSILRHSLSSSKPVMQEETSHTSSSFSDSFRLDSTNKRVRFKDQNKRKIGPSPELVELVRSDSETSLTSSSSGNLNSASEVSVSSGTGSLQEAHLVDYSLSSSTSNEKTERLSLGGSSRTVRQYSSNDSDYSTENESMFGADNFRRNDPNYSSADSFKSSAYSSSSSVKSITPPVRVNQLDIMRFRTKSESSEEVMSPVALARKGSGSGVVFREVPDQSDEDLQSSGSNSTLAESSSSDSEIVLASGIVIKREKFTSGSEFESGPDSSEDSGELTDRRGSSWFMTVMEHRASDAEHRASDEHEADDPIVEKEIIFKVRRGQGKGKKEVIETEVLPTPQFVIIEPFETSAPTVRATVPEVRRPRTLKPPPLELVVESLSSSSEAEDIPDVEERSVSSTSAPRSSPADVEEFELSDASSVSLTHITTLGSLTQTNSVFNLPASRMTTQLEDIKSGSESPTTTSTRGVHAPYDLVKQIVRENEALLSLHKEGRLNKLVSYSCSTLSSLATESVTSLQEQGHESSDDLYDVLGNNMVVRVSIGTSTDIHTSKAPLQSETISEYDMMGISNVELVLLDALLTKVPNMRVTSSTQTENDKARRKSWTLTHPSVARDSSTSATSSTHNQKKSEPDSDVTVSKHDSSSIFRSDSERSQVGMEQIAVKRTMYVPKSFAYKKDKGSPAPIIGKSGDGKYIRDFSTSTSGESAVSFHECHPQECIVSSDLFEGSLSSPTSDDKASHHRSGSDDKASHHRSGSDELRVSLKLSHDLSASSHLTDSEEDLHEASTVTIRTPSPRTQKRVQPRDFSYGLAPKQTKGSLVVKNREHSELSGSQESLSVSNTSSSSVQSANQRLVEQVFNEVAELINRSSQTTSGSKPPVKTDHVAEVSEKSTSTTVSYSVGEVVNSSGKSSNDAHSMISQSKSLTDRRTRSEERGSSEVDRYLLHLRSTSSSNLTSDSRRDPKKLKRSSSSSSEFEKLHKEIRDNVNSNRTSKSDTKSVRDSSNATLDRISSIKSSSKDNSKRYDLSNHDNEDKLEREWDSESEDDEDDSKSDPLANSPKPGAVGAGSSTSLHSGSDSKFSDGPRRKVPLPSYGSISSNHAVRLAVRTPNKTEESSLLGSSNLQSLQGVPKLSTLSASSNEHQPDVVGSSRIELVDSLNKSARKSSGKTSSFSSRLRASSQPAGSRDNDSTLNSGDHLTDEENLTGDELEEGDLVYSLKIAKERDSDSDIEPSCKNCDQGSDHTLSCGQELSEITDSAKYGRQRWEDDYGLLRALRWIFCPCRDG